MRLKNNPKAKGAIAASNLCIHDAASYKNNWKKSFSDNMPIFLEIGCGKGQFLTELAKIYTDNFYIGIEQYESVLFSAIKKTQENPLANLKFMCERAEYLCDFFAPGEVDGIFLNFSDPWPKKRHAKRRLTSDRFLEIYDTILVKDGIIEMKTDNVELFDFSLETISECDYFELIDYTRELYSNEILLAGNIPTEYETKFHSQGKPICKLIAKHK